MHRPTLYIGLFVIIGMCLVPPFQTGVVDRMGDALTGETVQTVEYRPIWSRPELEDNDIVTAIQGWEIDGSRLLLQILFVSVATAVVAYIRDGK